MIRQLSQFKDEEALDIIADILEIAVKICTNNDLIKAVKANKNRAEIAKIIIKSNKAEVMQLLSVLSDEEEYHCTGVSVISDVITLLNDKELMSFFTSQAQTNAQTS